MGHKLDIGKIHRKYKYILVKYSDMSHVYLRPYCVVHRSKTENSYMYSIIDEFHINICMKVHMVHNLNMILNI